MVLPFMGEDCDASCSVIMKAMGTKVLKDLPSRSRERSAVGRLSWMRKLAAEASLGHTGKPFSLAEILVVPRPSGSVDIRELMDHFRAD
jgi:hypothetical protein